jgi:hypothetical protein
MTDLDRGVLARLDRKLLAGLGQEETYRMVRVPATAAKWSTWKRYCDSAGVSMGRAIATLVDQELLAVVGAQAGACAVLAGLAEEDLARRIEQVARREQDATAVEERLRAWSTHLHTWEAKLEAREQRAELTMRMSSRPREVANNVGRNERCPCGSGVKYKHCHDRPGP